VNAPYGPTEPQQPQYGQQPPYGQQPVPPQGQPGQFGPGVPPPGTPTPPPEPSTVKTAFQLWVAALVLYVIAQVLAVLIPPSVEEYQEYFTSLGLPDDPQLIDTAVQTAGATSVVALVIVVLFAALFAWFGLKMRRGANWARITTAILAGLGILGALGGGVAALVGPLPAPGGVIGSLVQVITGLVFIGYLYFLFQKPSNQYFAAHSGRL
jgi:hypothetical protein